MPSNPNDVILKLADIWTSATATVGKIQDLADRLVVAEGGPNSASTAAEMTGMVAELKQLQTEFYPLKQTLHDSGNEVTDELRELELAWRTSVQGAVDSVRRAEARLQSSKSTFMEELAKLNRTQEMLGAYFGQ